MTKLLVCFLGVRAYLLGVAVLFIPLMLVRYVARQYRSAEGFPVTKGPSRILLLLFASAWLAFIYQIASSYSFMGGLSELYRSGIDPDSLPQHATIVDTEDYFDMLSSIRRASMVAAHVVLNVAVFSVRYWYVRRPPVKDAA